MGLPVEILSVRVRSELDTCIRQLPQHRFAVSDITFSNFPLVVDVHLRTPGPVWTEKGLGHINDHLLKIIIRNNLLFV